MGHASAEETSRGIEPPASYEALSSSRLSRGDMGRHKGTLPLHILSKADSTAKSAHGSNKTKTRWGSPPTEGNSLLKALDRTVACGLLVWMWDMTDEPTSPVLGLVLSPAYWHSPHNGF